MEIEPEIEIPLGQPTDKGLPFSLLIVGDIGFSGGAFLKEAVNHGYTVQVLVEKDEEEALVQEWGASPVRKEGTRPEPNRDLLQGIDIIVFFSPRVDTWSAWKESDSIRLDHFEQLLRLSIEGNVGRIVFLSSASVVFGSKAMIQIVEGYRPKKKLRDPYIHALSRAEEILKEYSSRIQVIILRVPIVWGPHMPLIEALRTSIGRSGLPVFGKPLHEISTIHVRNLCEAIFRSLGTDRSGTYFATDGEHRPAGEFLGKLMDAYGLEAGVKFVGRRKALWLAGLLEWAWRIFQLGGSPPLSRSMVYLLSTEFSLDDSKAKSELGYTPVIGIDQGLAELRQERDRTEENRQQLGPE